VVFCRDDDQWLPSCQSLGKKLGDRLGEEILALVKLKDVTGSDASAGVIVAAAQADVIRVCESINLLHRHLGTCLKPLRAKRSKCHATTRHCGKTHNLTLVPKPCMRFRTAEGRVISLPNKVRAGTPRRVHHATDADDSHGKWYD
jgi:hypothetical protein